MTDNPSDNDKREDADAEFQRVLGNLVNTPHKPHEPLKPKDAPDGKRSGRRVD
ncbi:MAG: hypothetical protein Q8L59_02590 [Phenylobacterium sp.]|nr:hypothetical protein [Phenylobacterium sp.]